MNHLDNLKCTVIVACSLNRVIGKNNQLPWHLSADLKRFKMLTMGRALLMGRKTYESIGCPLPGRRMIVLSRDVNLKIDGCEVIHCLSQLQRIVDPGEEVMVAGGEQVFKLLLPQTQKILLTEVQAEIEGDAYFPDINQQEWIEVARDTHCASDNNDHDYAFVDLIRR